MRKARILIGIMLVLACLTAGLAGAETVDLSYFRDKPDKPA